MLSFRSFRPPPTSIAPLVAVLLAGLLAGCASAPAQRALPTVPAPTVTVAQPGPTSTVPPSPTSTVAPTRTPVPPSPTPTPRPPSPTPTPLPATPTPEPVPTPTPGPRTDAQPRGYDCPPGAPIKGNINDRGEWIYHPPGGQFYTRTIPEACFATEAAARAAGFRRSLR